MPHEPTGGVSDEQIRAILRRQAHLSDQAIALLPHSDRVEMARLLARSNYVASAELELHSYHPARAGSLRYTPRSRVLALVLMLLTVTCLLITCGLFGRIIL